jgi:hypothetical protein
MNNLPINGRKIKLFFPETAKEKISIKAKQQ